jgi:hypothetical protein
MSKFLPDTWYFKNVVTGRNLVIDFGEGPSISQAEWKTG